MEARWGVGPFRKVMFGAVGQGEWPARGMGIALRAGTGCTCISKGPATRSRASRFMIQNHHGQSARRVMLYSHDSFGLGHLRRSLTLASTICEVYRDVSVLLVSGSPCASHFPLPEGVELVKLPTVTKDAHGDYVPRTSRDGTDRLLSLRQALVNESFRAFEPDLILVDHQPIGLSGELLTVLREAKDKGIKTVLGMRDIIDHPDVVARQWSDPGIREALRDLYTRVLVYGWPTVFDPRAAYPIPPELGPRIEFTGYVVRDTQTGQRSPRTRPHVLVTLGGGEDGDMLLENWFAAMKHRPPAFDCSIVLGPLMHAERARSFKRAARTRRGVHVRGFYGNMPRLLADSDLVLSMAGYNSACENLSARVPTVLCPRVHPRQEQLLRAQNLERLGLARMVLPGASPAMLREAVEQGLAARPDWSRMPPMDGRWRVCASLGEMLDLPPQSSHGAAAPALPREVLSRIP